VTEREFYLDALQEIVNTGFGRAAASLNTMLSYPIELQVPTISVLQLENVSDIPEDLGGDLLACVQLDFHGALNGTAALVFPPQSAAKLVSALLGEDNNNSGMTPVMAETLSEVGNIVINAVIGTIGNLIAAPFDYSLPNYREGGLMELLQPRGAGGAFILLMRTHFRVYDLQVAGNIFLVFEVNSFETLLSLIKGGQDEQSGGAVEQLLY
jgi:chemotaxis protein CheC